MCKALHICITKCNLAFLSYSSFALNNGQIFTEGVWGRWNEWSYIIHYRQKVHKTFKSLPSSPFASLSSLSHPHTHTKKPSPHFFSGPRALVSSLPVQVSLFSFLVENSLALEECDRNWIHYPEVIHNTLLPYLPLLQQLKAKNSISSLPGNQGWPCVTSGQGDISRHLLRRASRKAFAFQIKRHKVGQTIPLPHPLISAWSMDSSHLVQELTSLKTKANMLCLVEQKAQKSLSPWQHH